MLALARQHSERCQVAVVSNQAAPDGRSELIRAIGAAAELVLQNRKITIWHDAARDSGPTTAVMRRVARLASSECVICIPLLNERDVSVGAFVLFCGRKLLRDANILENTRQSTPPLAQHVQLLRAAHGGELRRLFRRLKAWLRGWRRSLFAVALIGTLGMFFLPLPYRLTCNCTLEPVTRRYVVAPFEGSLEKSFVEPGDLVAQGDMLARMDERELRLEIGALNAEYLTAQKKRDAALASRSGAEAQLSELEMERLQAQIDMLDRRNEHLTIRSPLDGIVVHGDLKRSEGAPLSVGQALFEIAPLGQMVAEVEIREDEIANVTENLPVTLRLDAFSAKTWSTTLDRVYPRAESRDAQYVFLGEVRLPNADGLLRPGMNGRAKIVGPRRSLGWILFHRPWNELQKYVGW